MNKNSLIRRTALKMSFMMVLFSVCLLTIEAQTNPPQDEPFDSPVVPPTCEEWILYVSDAVRRWGKNKDASFIVIAKLGDRETSRRTTLKRIKTLKDYILVPRWKVKAVFAEGERVEDFGIIEFYVEGKLLYSLPVKRNEDIPLKFCNP